MKTLNKSRVVLITALVAIAQSAYAQQPPDVVNSDAYFNTAMDTNTLLSLTPAAGIGSDNTASGVNALYANTTGNDNSASGHSALHNNTTGNSNIAMGFQAGFSLTTGSYNIDIGNPGEAAESNTIRIGTSTPTAVQTKTFIAGIDGVSVTGSGANKLASSKGPQPRTLTATAVIQHVVVIFQENRTPDNLFHDPVLIARGADIASSGKNSLGQTITLSSIDLGTSGSNPQNYDVAHGHGAFIAMYDGGKMDGADKIRCSPTAQCPPNAHPNPQFTYVNPSDVQPYFALAEQYAFGDRMFQTNQGASFPAHQFIVAGTSAPKATSPLFADSLIAGGGRRTTAGCIAPLTARVRMIDATGSQKSSAPEYPCFEHPTLSDLLEKNGVTWRYYAPSAGSHWTGPNAIEHICQPKTINGELTCTGPDWTHNVIIPQWKILVDIANGQLPQVSWIIPNGRSSDHAVGNDGSGPSWVAAIVNAIGNSPYWANTAIIITWDDWGGWYDHVAPKVINDGVSWGSGYVYGFRVPLIVVSPYAKAAYISHTTHDFGSILKYIETVFKLPSLGYADTPADDLSDCFNLTQSPLTFHTIPAALDASQFIKDKRPTTDPDSD
jgi:phospholipase C